MHYTDIAEKIISQELRDKIGAESVDFCEQIGVYLLHDNSNVVYVGRATDRSLGKRMHEHT